MDELKLQFAANKKIKDCCILLITETWLHSSIPDTATEITGCAAHRYDRNSDSGKNRGGGLCIYVTIGPPTIGAPTLLPSIAIAPLTWSI
jgi:hypothetical protein